MGTGLRRWEWMALAALMAAALILRLYALQRIPAVVFHDECDNLVNAYQILNGRGPGFFGFDWKPQPAASVYLLSLSMRLGMSILTLRLPAVLFSIAALFPFYLLLRQTVVAPAALLATGLLATDIWYLHFSRSGWENIQTCLFLMAGALCAHNGLRTGRARSFVWAGVWSACGAYGYFGGRAVFPALLLSGALSLLRPRVSPRRLLSGLGLMTCVAVLLFAPQLRTIVHQWDHFQHRSRAVYILAGDNEHKSAAEKVGILAESFARKAYQLFSREIPGEYERPDRYLRVEDGALVRPTVLLLGVGMLSSIFWFSETWLWWVLFLVPFGLTEVLTTGSLNGARGIIFVPVLYLFVGLSLHAGWQLCTRIYRPLAALIVIGVLVLCVSTTRQYFKWVQSRRVTEALEPAIPVTEFAQWQAFLLQWTATRSDFFTVFLWKDRQQHLRQQQAQAAAESNGTGSVSDQCAATETLVTPACSGDCDGSGDIAVNELVLMVNIALGEAPLAACMGGDTDGSGDLGVNEIIAAVNNALAGCPTTK